MCNHHSCKIWTKSIMACFLLYLFAFFIVDKLYFEQRIMQFWVQILVELVKSFKMSPNMTCFCLSKAELQATKNGSTERKTPRNRILKCCIWGSNGSLGLQFCMISLFRYVYQYAKFQPNPRGSSFLLCQFGVEWPIRITNRQFLTCKLAIFGSPTPFTRGDEHNYAIT